MKEKILIIEDEDALRQTLTDLMEINGYVTNVASNGLEGIQRILEILPDLVICDVNMPSMNGFEVLSTVNSRMSDDLVPAFLFLTARVGAEDIRKGLKLGADDYLVKPFETTELISSIRMRLDKRKKLLEYKNSHDNAKVKISKSENSPLKLALPNSDGIRYVALKDIIRCEADRAYCIFYLENAGRIVISRAMGEFEEILINNGFCKVHRSHIVNIEAIEQLINKDGGYLILKDKSQIPLSVRRKQEVIAQLNASERK